MQWNFHQVKAAAKNRFARRTSSGAVVRPKPGHKERGANGSGRLDLDRKSTRLNSTHVVPYTPLFRSRDLPRFAGIDGKNPDLSGIVVFALAQKCNGTSIR